MLERYGEKSDVFSILVVASIDGLVAEIGAAMGKVGDVLSARA